MRKHSSRVARVTVSLPFETVHTAPNLLCVDLALVALPPFEHACAVVLEPRVEEAEHLGSSKKGISWLLSLRVAQVRYVVSRVSKEGRKEGRKHECAR